MRWSFIKRRETVTVRAATQSEIPCASRDILRSHPERHFRVLSSPELHSLVVGSQEVEVLLVHGEEATGHGGAAVGELGPAAVPLLLGLGGVVPIGKLL